jgi:hypothetical protein
MPVFPILQTFRYAGMQKLIGSAIREKQMDFLRLTDMASRFQSEKRDFICPLLAHLGCVAGCKSWPVIYAKRTSVIQKKNAQIYEFTA